MIKSVFRRIAPVLVSLAALAACGGDEDSDTAAGVIESTVAETTGEATTTTEAIETTTTQGHTGDRKKLNCQADEDFEDDDGDGWGECVPGATTPAISPGEEQDVTVLFFGSRIETDPELRSTLNDAIEEASFSVDSVDVITFTTTDIGTADLEIAITSGYNSVEIRDQVAWELASGLAFMWEVGDTLIFRNDEGTVKVGFVLTVDTTTYRASYDQMVTIADKRITSTDWLNATRL